MTRLSTLGFFAWISVFGLGNQVIAAFPGIINQQVAAAHGLTRAWYSQIEMDSGSGRVAHMVLAGAAGRDQMSQRLQDRWTSLPAVLMPPRGGRLAQFDRQ